MDVSTAWMMVAIPCMLAHKLQGCCSDGGRSCLDSSTRLEGDAVLLLNCGCCASTAGSCSEHKSLRDRWLVFRWTKSSIRFEGGREAAAELRLSRLCHGLLQLAQNPSGLQGSFLLDCRLHPGSRPLRCLTARRAPETNSPIDSAWAYTLARQRGSASPPGAHGSRAAQKFPAKASTSHGSCDWLIPRQLLHSCAQP